MIKKWKQKAIGMDLKKAVVIFLITCLVLLIAAPTVLYKNFLCLGRDGARDLVLAPSHDLGLPHGIPYGRKRQTGGTGGTVFQPCGSDGSLSLWYTKGDL